MTTRIERLQKEIGEISKSSVTEAQVKDATDVLRHEVYDTVRGIASSVLEAIASGEIEAEDFGDRLHEECDSACIYTADCYKLCWLLDDASEGAEDMGDLTDVTKAVSTQAYLNLREECATMIQRCLDSADWETEDDTSDDTAEE